MFFYVILYLIITDNILGSNSRMLIISGIQMSSKLLLATYSTIFMLDAPILLSKTIWRQVVKTCDKLVIGETCKLKKNSHDGGYHWDGWEIIALLF